MFISVEIDFYAPTQLEIGGILSFNLFIWKVVIKIIIIFHEK